MISGLGNTTLQERVIVTATDEAQAAGLRSVLVADFDGQPPLDLAANDGTGLDIYLAQADGSHGPAASISGGKAVGDVDADGRADVAGGTLVGSHDRSVLIQFSGSDAAFGRKLTLPVPYLPLTVFVADFDGDGANDVAALLFRSPQALLQVFLGTGQGSFRAAELVSVPFDPNTPVFAADVDHDGRADLLAQADGKVLELSGACVTR